LASRKGPAEIFALLGIIEQICHQGSSLARFAAKNQKSSRLTGRRPQIAVAQLALMIGPT